MTSSSIKASLLLAIIFIAEGCLAQQVTIESPRETDWGDWGIVELCPPSTFVYGMRMKVQPSMGFFVDDTALNGIELLCVSAIKRKNATNNKEFASITSSEGPHGVLGTILECPYPGYAKGFVLRSEDNQHLEDDTAANDLRLYCSTPDAIIGGYNATDFGDWTTPQMCPPGFLICGIQTQVEEVGNSDDTTLNNVNMVCCDSGAPPTEAPPTRPPQ